MGLEDRISNPIPVPIKATAAKLAFQYTEFCDDDAGQVATKPNSKF